MEFFLPVYGFVKFSDAERLVIDHPAFQRLGKVYQLAQTHLVFRGATHTRLEHAMGVCHIAGEMIKSVNENTAHLRDVPSRHENRPNSWVLGEPLSEHETAFIRLAALLHDIGHIPFGHTLEDEVEVIQRHHDGWDRVNQILDKKNWGSGYQGASLREIIDQAYRTDLANSANSQRRGRAHNGGFRPSDLLMLILCAKDEHRIQARSRFSDNTVFRLDVYRHIVADTICADLLDYLQRDWYHIGKVRAIDSRLFQYMQIRRPPEASSPEQDRFVISLGERPRLKTDAVSMILTLLESRYELWQVVLLHRVKLAATAMLERSIQELISSQVSGRGTTGHSRPVLDSEELEAFLLRNSDEQALAFLEDLSRPNPPAYRLLSLLRQRRIYNTVYDCQHDELSTEQFLRLDDLYGKRRIGGQRRLEVARLLERDFQLISGSLAIYCVPMKLTEAKLPKVSLHVDGLVAKFQEWEHHGHGISSCGAIEAQERRFKRLWRISFFLAEDEKERLESQGLLGVLTTAIQHLAVGLPVQNETLLQASRRLAQRVFTGLTLRSELEGDYQRYPTGAPTLLSWRA